MTQNELRRPLICTGVNLQVFESFRNHVDLNGTLHWLSGLYASNVEII